MKLSATLLSLILVASSFTKLQTWYSYENKETKISISFPAEFEEAKTEKEKSTTYKVQVQNEDMMYLASSSIHKSSLEKDIEGLQETSVESFRKSLNATLISVTPIALKSVSGSFAIFSYGEQNAKIEYRVFLKDKLQYQIITAQLGEEFDQDSADKFYNSFKILN